MTFKSKNATSLKNYHTKSECLTSKPLKHTSLCWNPNVQSNTSDNGDNNEKTENLNNPGGNIPGGNFPVGVFLIPKYSFKKFSKMKKFVKALKTICKIIVLINQIHWYSNVQQNKTKEKHKFLSTDNVTNYLTSWF